MSVQHGTNGMQTLMTSLLTWFTLYVSPDDVASGMCHACAWQMSLHDSGTP